MASSLHNAGRTGRLVRPERVIVFDLDDTLYLERDFVLSGFRAVGSWAETQLGIADLTATMIDCFQSGARGNVFDDALARHGVVAHPVTIARMIQVYRQHDPVIALAPDAERFLARLTAPAGTRLAIGVITDGFRDAQKRKLRALQVHRRGVDFAVCTDRWGRAHWKPSPRAFECVEAFFGVSGPALTYVADNPNKDFHAPKHLDWHTVQIDRVGRLESAIVDGASHAARSVSSFDDLDG